MDDTTPTGRSGNRAADHNGSDSTATAGVPGGRGQTRRTFLRTTAGVAAAAGVGITAGSAAARGIPTPWLQRDGNKIVDDTGSPVTLRGVNVCDPARAANTFYRRPVPETVRHATDPERDWYARIIRVPCQPGDVAGLNTPEPEPVAFDKETLRTFCSKHLDPVVDECEAVGAYCIVDYHRHRTNDYDRPAMHDELTRFWRVVADRYADRSHVLFEVYNEPIDPYPGHGKQNLDVKVTEERAKTDGWDVWKETAQPWVDTIRANAPENVVLVGSPRWSQYTYWAPENEFEGDNIAYVGHVYTHKNLRPLADYFGAPAEEVPVFMTEFGYQNEKPDGSDPAEFIAGTTSDAGEDFKSFFENHPHVHWQVWCFDPFWEPVMFGFDDATHEWSLLGGETWQGEFFRDYLKAKRNDDLPGGAGDEKPPALDGTVPGDVDDDGTYEDFTGNGEVDNQDVITYFQNMEDGGYLQQHVDYFDYTGNGDIDYQDLISLFGRI